MIEVEIDREFASLCPSLTTEEHALLEASIVADGCREPLTIWANHQGILLDGHNRHQICTKHELPYKTRALSFETRDECAAWIIRNQCGRRNVTESQKSILAAKLANLGEGRPTETASHEAVSQSAAAEEFGISRSTVQRAAKVVEHGTAALTKAVQDGEISVNQAAVIAELPKAVQRKVVAKGPEAVAEKAKEVKAEKAAVKKYKDEFDTAKLDKELAKDKKPGSVKKQWDDKAVAEAIGQFGKQIDAAYGGFVKLFDECHANVGGRDADLARAKRAAAQGKGESHKLLDGVTAAFRLWRPAK